MLRRDFLAQLAAGAASVALGRSGSAFAYTKKSRAAPSPPPKLDRIAISSWSLHNYFRATRESDFNLPGPMLALLDFPEMIVERYKVRHFEFCATHFPSTEPAYLRELKYALVHTLSTIVNISVDIEECGPEGTFSDPDHEGAPAALDAVKPWVDVAHTLGAKSVRVGPGKVDPENLAPTAESYKALATLRAGQRRPRDGGESRRLRRRESGGVGEARQAGRRRTHQRVAGFRQLSR